MILSEWWGLFSPATSIIRLVPKLCLGTQVPKLRAEFQQMEKSTSP